MTKPSQKRKKFTRNNFDEQNYIYVNPSQTTHPPPNKHAKSIILTEFKFSKYIIKFSKFP